MSTTTNRDIGGAESIRSTLLVENKKAESPVQIILGTMTEHQRNIFTAFYFEKKNMAEIAKERNVRISTVSRTLARAENHVKEIAAIARALRDMGWI